MAFEIEGNGAVADRWRAVLGPRDRRALGDGASEVAWQAVLGPLAGARGPSNHGEPEMECNVFYRLSDNPDRQASCTVSLSHAFDPRDAYRTLWALRQLVANREGCAPADVEIVGVSEATAVSDPIKAAMLDYHRWLLEAYPELDPQRAVEVAAALVQARMQYWLARQAQSATATLAERDRAASLEHRPRLPEETGGSDGGPGEHRPERQPERQPEPQPEPQAELPESQPSRIPPWQAQAQPPSPDRGDRSDRDPRDRGREASPQEIASPSENRDAFPQENRRHESPSDFAPRDFAPIAAPPPAPEPSPAIAPEPDPEPAEETFPAIAFVEPLRRRIQARAARRPSTPPSSLPPQYPPLPVPTEDPRPSPRDRSFADFGAADRPPASGEPLALPGGALDGDREASPQENPPQDPRLAIAPLELHHPAIAPLEPEVAFGKANGPDLEGSAGGNPTLGNLNFKDLDLGNPDRRNPDRRRSDLEHSGLEHSGLEDPELENSNLADSNLRDSDLEDSALEDSDLEDSDLEDSDLENSDLEDSGLENQEDSDPEDSDLADLDLEDSDLEDLESTNSGVRISYFKSFELEAPEPEPSPQSRRVFKGISPGRSPGRSPEIREPDSPASGDRGTEGRSQPDFDPEIADPEITDPEIADPEIADPEAPGDRETDRPMPPPEPRHTGPQLPEFREPELPHLPSPWDDMLPESDLASFVEADLLDPVRFLRQARAKGRSPDSPPADADRATSDPTDRAAEFQPQSGFQADSLRGDWSGDRGESTPEDPTDTASGDPADRAPDPPEAPEDAPAEMHRPSPADENGNGNDRAHGDRAHNDHAYFEAWLQQQRERSRRPPPSN